MGRDKYSLVNCEHMVGWGSIRKLFEKVKASGKHVYNDVVKLAYDKWGKSALESFVPGGKANTGIIETGRGLVAEAMLRARRRRRVVFYNLRFTLLMLAPCDSQYVASTIETITLDGRPHVEELGVDL
jgi:hypothetical protein